MKVWDRFLKTQENYPQLIIIFVTFHLLKMENIHSAFISSKQLLSEGVGGGKLSSVEHFWVHAQTNPESVKQTGAHDSSNHLFHLNANTMRASYHRPNADVKVKLQGTK
jgi:hypothetical protein